MRPKQVMTCDWEIEELISSYVSAGAEGRGGKQGPGPPLPQNILNFFGN